MTQSRQHLRQILLEMRDLGHQKIPYLVVYDLDSTLFDVSPRLQKILMDFAEVPENKKKFPEQIKFFKNIQMIRSDWGIKNALIRAGLDGHHPEFQIAVKKFWMEKFFTNEYLQYDTPYDGAVEYVKATAHAGAQITYLTGRDVHRMGTGSEKILHHWGFPLDDQQSQLVLKPHKDLDDAEFKKDWLLHIQKNNYKKIWLFENEPVNIQLAQQALPNIEIVFMDSTHSGILSTPINIPKIINYLCELHD